MSSDVEIARVTLFLEKTELAELIECIEVGLCDKITEKFHVVKMMLLQNSSPVWRIQIGPARAPELSSVESSNPPLDIP